MAWLTPHFRPRSAVRVIKACIFNGGGEYIPVTSDFLSGFTPASIIKRGSVIFSANDDLRDHP
jgi:hypothetical protein